MLFSSFSELFIQRLRTIDYRTPQNTTCVIFVTHGLSRKFINRKNENMYK